MPNWLYRRHIFVLTVNERILQPQDIPRASAMKERIRVDQNVVEAKGFTNSSSLEIEITEPEGQRFPPPQKKEGARGKIADKAGGATGPEEEPVPVNKH